MQDAIVVIQGDKISSAGPASQITLPAGTEVLDVGDRTVMPGMIDAHVHMLSTGSNSSGVESRAMTDSQSMLVAARNALMAIRSSLTTVRDCGDRNFLSLTLRDSIADDVIPGAPHSVLGPAHYQHCGAALVERDRERLRGRTSTGRAHTG